MILLAFLVGLITGMGLIVWLSWPSENHPYPPPIKDGQIMKPNPLRTPDWEPMYQHEDDRIVVEDFPLCDECNTPITAEQRDRWWLCGSCEMADEEQRNWDQDR